MTNQKSPYGKIADGKRNSKKRYVTYRKTNKKKAQIPPEEKESVRIAFLGGINEIGKNMTLYEYGNDMFLVDCGLAFPDSDLPGVDLVIPEESWEQKINDVKEYHVDTVVMGGDWAGSDKFDYLKDYCELVFLDRTPGVSTTQIKKDLGLQEAVSGIDQLPGEPEE